MHNCKANRERLIEAAMTSTSSDQSLLEQELRGCPSCLAEFESVRSSLRITEQAMRVTRRLRVFGLDTMPGSGNRSSAPPRLVPNQGTGPPCLSV